jgi:hypothetical protein
MWSSVLLGVDLGVAAGARPSNPFSNKCSWYFRGMSLILTQSFRHPKVTSQSSRFVADLPCDAAGPQTVPSVRTTNSTNAHSLPAFDLRKWLLAQRSNWLTSILTQCWTVFTIFLLAFSSPSPTACGLLARLQGVPWQMNQIKLWYRSHNERITFLDHAGRTLYNVRRTEVRNSER